MCCTPLADNTGRKKSPFAHHRTILLGYIFATKARIDNGENLLSSKISSINMSSQCGERQPTNGWDRFGSLEHPSKFQWVSLLSFATAPTSLNGGQSNLARRLAVSWTGTLYIHFGAVAHNRIHFAPNSALSYIGSVTVRHSSSGRQQNFAAWYLYATGRPSRFDIKRLNCLVRSIFSCWL